MAISSVGTVFTTGQGGISGDVKSISFGGVSCTAIDVTLLSSTNKSYVLGMQDGGTVSISCFAKTSTDKPDLPLAGTNTLITFTVAFGPIVATQTRPTATFRGYLMSVTMGANIDEAVTCDYEIRIADSAGTAGAALLTAITWGVTTAGT